MMRTTDQEVSAIEKTVCYGSQEEACAAGQGHLRKPPGQSGGGKSEGGTGRSLRCAVFSGEEWARQGRLGMGWLGSFWQARGLGGNKGSPQASGSWLCDDQDRRYCLLEHRTQLGAKCGLWGGQFASERQCSLAGLVLSPRTGQPWDGQPFPSGQGPRCQSMTNTEAWRRHSTGVSRGGASPAWGLE